MICILSPAKTMRQANQWPLEPATPLFAAEAKQIMQQLKTLDKTTLQPLLSVSGNLLNKAYSFIQSWSFPHQVETSAPAMLAYDGIAFKGLQASDFNDAEWTSAMRHLRLISAVYGMLRPGDAIMPYRLEMQARLQGKSFKNLYDFWGSKIASAIEQDMKNAGQRWLINIASEEYSKAVLPYLKNHTKVIHAVFKELRGSKYVINTVQAKYARGLMARFIIEHDLNQAGDLRAFDLHGYRFDEQLSDESTYTFIRL